MSRRVFHITALFTLPLVFTLCGSGGGDLTGGIEPARYLSGRFVPEKNSFFVRLDTLGIPCDRPQFLRREAAAALVDMFRAFRLGNPSIPFIVRSSTRTFDDQSAIWTRKWNDLCERDQAMSDRERAGEILRYSSMPGTSRHHWGTDFDLNELVNGYYDRGDGRVLYQWLKVNAGRYGFFQPYTAGRLAGYAEERWHWSYGPLSIPLREQWNSTFNGEPQSLIRQKEYPGAHLAGELAPVYVNGITEPGQ